MKSRAPDGFVDDEAAETAVGRGCAVGREFGLQLRRRYIAGHA
jgi:hypothetical protein